MIRELGEDEWELLRELRLRALRESPDAFSPRAEDVAREAEDYWRRGARMLASEQARLFVAERDGARRRARLGDGRRRDRLHRRDVDRSRRARRRGSAGRCSRSACAWLRARGCARLALTVTETNAAAIALYESAGFRLTGESEPLREGSPLRNLKMIATGASA